MKIAKNTVAGLSNKYVNFAKRHESERFWYWQALSHNGHRVVFPGPFVSHISLL